MNAAWQQGHLGNYEDRYRTMEELRQNPYHAYTATPSGDRSVIDGLLDSIKEGIDTPASDATVTFDPSLSYPFIFTDEVYGLRLDTAPIKEELYKMVSEMRTGTVELKPETVYPRVLKEELEKHYALRSSAVTPISTSSEEERNNNIRRAFELINGSVLEPGASFSFNGVVGERTLANGFYPATEYVYNEHVEGVGGGVCQASTTLYQAAVMPGYGLSAGNRTLSAYPIRITGRTRLFIGTGSEELIWFSETIRSMTSLLSPVCKRIRQTSGG